MLNYILWNPSPNAITIGSFSVQWYGLCWGTAILLCYFLAQWFCKREGKDPEKMADLMIYVFSAALIGARLAQAIFYEPELYLQNPVEIFKVWKGGLASHGGVVGVFVGMWIFSKKFPDYGYLWLMERTAITAMIAGILIRFGNLMNSEIVGKVTDVSWAFIFERVDELPRHPTVLYEAIAYLLIFIFQLLLYRKIKNLLPGIYLSVFLTVVFSTRLLLEFTKQPESSGVFGLSNTQTLSLPLIAAGLIMFALTFSGKLKNVK
ncbi:MAG: prolipoprotein diacylglyceryl transferase [Chitinophagales bacterium]|nr:prolipoprotein diacylglyceryl transferase [Chitinophagales bacterium]HRP38110.1 prolipoprotein diacylglyceryl transferase [Chitinophagales bacterium]